MSYTIEYNPQKKKRYPMVVQHKKKLPPVLVMIALVLALYFVNRWDVFAVRSRWYSALEIMADRIRNGTQIGQSIAQCFSLLNG